jgi:hypothetical protein
MVPWVEDQEEGRIFCQEIRGTLTSSGSLLLEQQYSLIFWVVVQVEGDEKEFP